MRRSKGGIRPDLGRYFRSAWEANIARYLNFLQKHGEIESWEYESEENSDNIACPCCGNG